MRRDLTVTKFAILILIAILSSAVIYLSLGHTTHDVKDISPQFTNRSIRGGYGFSMEGFSISKIDKTIIPASSVGQFCADGNGTIFKGIGTLNMGGEIQEQVITGSYNVNPDGTGIIEFASSTEAPDGTLISTSVFSGSFVIVQNGKMLQSIGTSIKGPDGEDLDFEIVSHVVVRKQ